MCDKYNLDYIRCADELFSFARVYSRFDSSVLYSEVHQDEEMLDEDEIYCEVDEDITIDCDEQQTGGKFGESGQNCEKSSVFSVLAILCSPAYHLMDAYPQLCKMYQSVAIPISLCTAEGSFSALKRIKHA